MKKPATYFVYGLCLGTCEVMPGISGGAVALILGFYKQLIDSIRSVTPKNVWRLLARKDKLPEAAANLSLPFLVPLFGGVVVAFAIASRIIPSLIKTYPSQANALIFGLILASSYIPFSMLKEKGLRELLFIVGFAFFAYFVVGIPTTHQQASLPYIFMSGSIAICAMILPGISGSYILKTMGQYEYMLTQLENVFSGDTQALTVVVVFLLGIVLGITTFVRILSWALHRYESETCAALTGLMLGSLRAVWPFENMTQIGPAEMTCLTFILVGIVAATGLIRLDKSKS